MLCSKTLPVLKADDTLPKVSIHKAKKTEENMIPEFGFKVHDLTVQINFIRAQSEGRHTRLRLDSPFKL